MMADALVETAVPLTRDQMEIRRLLAAAELQSGSRQSSVAKRYGVSRTTASRWYRTLFDQGVDALRQRKASGRPCRLNSDQLREVAALYQSGPRAAGLEGEKWTIHLFTQAIEAQLNVKYDPDHVGRIIHKLGLRPPRRRRILVPTIC